MSDGHEDNRQPDLGMFGFLTAFVLCLIIVGVLAYGSGLEDERRSKAPASYSQAAKDDARRACINAEPLATFECIYEKVEASQEQARGEQDLTAQQRSAFAALASAIVALFTLCISGIGVWYVKRTLDATLTAVKDTGEATVAMREANRIANLAQRPWVEMIIVDHNEFEATPRFGRVSVNVKIINRGNTPAVEVMGRLAILGLPTGTEGGRQMMIDEINRQIDMLDLHHNGFGRLVFPQSDDAASPYGDNLFPETMKEIMDGEYGHGQFWVGLGVRYKFADQTARTVYCYLLSTNKFGQNIPISDDTILHGDEFTLEGMAGEYAT